MPSKPDTREKTLLLLMVLVAGCVDAIGFKSAEIFPANMTGNAVLIASSLAKATPLIQAANPAMVLLSFCMGSALATLLTRLPPLFRCHSVSLTLLLAGLLLSACGISLLFKSKGSSFPLTHLLLIALAMGLQSSAALAMNIPGAGITTVITSTLTIAISKITTSLCQIFSREKEVTLDAAFFSWLVFGVYLTGALLGALPMGIPTGATTLLAGATLTGVAIARDTKL